VEERNAVSVRKVLFFAVMVAAVAMVFMPRSAGPANFNLTDSEQDWLQAHPVIRLGTIDNWPPISMRDNEGSLSGIAGDYRRLIENYARFRFSLEPEISFEEMWEKTRRGEIDVVMVLGRTPDRAQYLLFTDALLELPYVVIVRSDNLGIHGVADLVGKNVSVRKRFPSEEWLATSHPAITLFPKDDVGDALQSVISGEADAFVGGALPASYEMALHGMSGLKVAAPVNFTNQLRIGVRKDWPELVSILNKTLTAIPDEQHKAVLSLWANQQPRGIDPLAVAWMVAGFGIMLAVSLLYGNIRLRKSYKLVDERVRERTEELRKINAELGESEERYRQAFQESGAVKLIIEPDTGKIEDANGAACRFYGYSREELLSKQIGEINILSPEEIKAAMEDVRGEKKRYFIFRHRLASGALRDVEVYSSPVIIGGKTLLHSIVHDVTERKKSEDLLRCRADLSELAASASLDQLIQSGLDMVERLTFSKIAFFHFIEDDQENLRLQTWSTNTLENMCKAEGKGTHYPISKAGVWVDCFHKRRPVMYNDYASLTHKKGMPDGHATVARVVSIPVIKDGKVKVILGVGNKKTDYDQADVDMAVQTASILYDLVERKKLEEELNESERHFRLLVESSPFCIHEIGLDGRILSMNRAGLEMFGLKSEADVVGLSYLNAVGSADRGRIGELLTQAYQGTSSHFEFASSSEVSRTFKSCFIPIKDADGVTTKLMGITEDVTERKMGEIALLEAKKNAEDANSLKDKFVSLVSHDLMAPLSGILGFLRLVRMESGEKLGADPRKMVDLAVSSGEHMANLIQDILSLSRLRTGALKPTMEFFDASLIGEKMAADYQYTAYAKGVVLENLIPGKTRVYSDKTLLTEAVQNFVTNAIKFCGKGNSVTVSVEKGEKTTVWVADTGPGIDPSLMRKLVDHEGYRSKQGTGGEKGTGYGLIITREMIEALGGELLIETESGKGSRFGVRIPSIRPKILLVDSDANFRVLMRRHLEAVDTDVLEADDGVCAVEKIAGGESLPHLIIFVMETSGMSGLGLLSHLQMRGGTKPIPVIIVSEKRGLGQQAAVYGLMAQEYLFKPLDVEDFIARVRMYVG